MIDANAIVTKNITELGIKTAGILTKKISNIRLEFYI